MFNNSKALSSSSATAVAPSGKINPFHVGVLAKSEGLTLTNGTSGTIQSIVTGNEGAFAAGVATEARTTITNSGVIDATIKAASGSAYGIFSQAGDTTIWNGRDATISATSPGYAAGAKLFWTNKQDFRNFGTLKATSTGTATDGTQHRESAVGIDSYTFKTGSTFIKNVGEFLVSSVDPTRGSYSTLIWNCFAAVTLENHGLMSSINTKGKAHGAYFGTNGFDTQFSNTGLFQVDGAGEGASAANEGGVHGVWMEIDQEDPNVKGTQGRLLFNNSGTIATNSAFAVSFSSYTPGPWQKSSFTNTGSISGNWLGLGWPGDLDFYNSGDILTTLAWLGSDKSNVRAVISGLPRIEPVLSASKNGNNTLTFNLTGTLELVNGKAPPAGALALESKGNIQVSGHVYKWENFKTVKLNLTAPVAKVAGPTGLAAKQVSLSDATLAWNAVAGATGYTVKRSQTPNGPYTVFARNVSGTSWKDTAAFKKLDSYYVVSATIGGVETADSDEVSIRHLKLSGTPIGSAGAASTTKITNSSASANVIANVFDHDLYSYYATAAGTGGWVGLDFGQGNAPVVKRIAFSPRMYKAADMVGGRFEGSNDAAFANAVTLYTIARKPLMGLLNTVDIANSAGYRYVRYVGADGSPSALTELEFYAY